MQIPLVLPGLWCTAWKLRRRRKVKILVGRKHVWNTPMNADADNERPAEILKIWDGRLIWVRQVRPVQQFGLIFCRIPILVQIWANLSVEFSVPSVSINCFIRGPSMADSAAPADPPAEGEAVPEVAPLPPKKRTYKIYHFLQETFSLSFLLTDFLLRKIHSQLHAWTSQNSHQR